MSVLNVVMYPDDPLTKKAEPFETIGPEVAKLAEDMLETMHAHDGVGLAGPQVGLAKRIFVMQPPDGDPLCLVNPEIISMEGSADGEEGCLSMPRVYSDRVPRATTVRVRAHDEKGVPIELEAHDFVARIIQHEYDHLEGVLFVDRLDIISRESLLQEWNAVRSELEADGTPAG